MSKPENIKPEIINLLDFPEGESKVIADIPVIVKAVDIPEAVVAKEIVKDDVKEQGNMAAAMNKVAETLNLNRKKNTGSKTGEPAQRQVLLRASAEDHDRWKKTAELRGVALSELIRELCNLAAQEALDCTHPAEFRQTYKWSDTCLKCNTRLRGWQ
jgi:hypothetical protein